MPQGWSAVFKAVIYWETSAFRRGSGCHGIRGTNVMFRTACQGVLPKLLAASGRSPLYGNMLVIRRQKVSASDCWYIAIHADTETLHYLCQCSVLCVKAGHCRPHVGQYALHQEAEPFRLITTGISPYMQTEALYQCPSFCVKAGHC